MTLLSAVASRNHRESVTVLSVLRRGMGSRPQSVVFNYCTDDFPRRGGPQCTFAAFLSASGQKGPSVRGAEPAAHRRAVNGLHLVPPVQAGVRCEWGLLFERCGRGAA